MSERRSELKAVASTEEMTAGKMSDRDPVQVTARMMDGWSQIQGRLMSMAQNSLRNTMTAAEELRQCQSPKEAMDCQIKLARQSYDDAMDGGRQIADAMARMSADAMGYFGMPR